MVIASWGTPGPIPNPEAKPDSADGTATEGLWESRTPPNTTSHSPAPVETPMVTRGRAIFRTQRVGSRTRTVGSRTPRVGSPSDPPGTPTDPLGTRDDRSGTAIPRDQMDDIRDWVDDTMLGAGES